MTDGWIYVTKLEGKPRENEGKSSKRESSKMASGMGVCFWTVNNWQRRIFSILVLTIVNIVKSRFVFRNLYKISHLKLNPIVQTAAVEKVVHSFQSHFHWGYTLWPFVWGEETAKITTTDAFQTPTVLSDGRWTCLSSQKCGVLLHIIEQTS